MSAPLPIADGFVYSTKNRPINGWYLPSVLCEIDTLRRLNNYQPRYYTVPDSSTALILPYQSYEYQVDVTLGTVLWAFSFSNPSGLYSFNIFDPCSGRLGADGILASGTSTTTWQGVCIFPKPYIVAGNLLSVEINTLSPTQANTSLASELQLLLICMEPVEKACERI
jgi:hypothetical protein